MIDYVIIDFENRKLVVVEETVSKYDAQKALEKYKDGSCEIYVENGNGGKCYRIICTQEKVGSDGNL